MALYSNSAFRGVFKPIKKQGTQVEPNYLFGNFDFDTADYEFAISNVALTSNVATLTVTLTGGGGGGGAIGQIFPVPQVGSKAGVRGLPSAVSFFNVDPIPGGLTGVTLTSGTGTVTYALTHANQASTPAAGKLVVWPYEQPDLVALNSASAPLALSFMPDEADNSRCLFAEAVWSGTLPSAATVSLQTANVDDDSRYATVGTINTIASSAVTQQGAQFNFLMGKFIRAKVTAMTGGDGTTGLVCTVFI